MTPNAAALRAANQRRAEAAAEVTVERARRAIAVLSAAGPAQKKDLELARRQYLGALRMRLQYPDATLAELGALSRLGKDRYASRLRRALACAERLEGAS